MRFEKWQALGNDYVIIEADALPFALTPARVSAICAPHTGVSSDGVVLLSAAEEPGYLARLRIFNPDGSEAEVSGNGAREAVLYMRRRGLADSDTFSLQTAAGELRPTITSAITCTMEMGKARLAGGDFPSGGPDGRGELEAAGRTWRFQFVQVGNPQCAIEVADRDELEALDLASIGPPVEGHELFPNRANVSWYTALASGRIRARMFERGVGETAASGTGASGAATAYVLGGGQSPVTVELDGGELEVEVGRNLDIRLTGWALPVYSGVLSDEFVEYLHALE